MAAENATTTITNATLVTTSETIITTLVMPPVNEPGSLELMLKGAADITAGTVSTGVNYRIRIGGLTGTVVNGTVWGVSAGGNGVTGVIDPTTSYPNGVTYVHTAQQVGATGNGTVTAVFLNATPITNFGG